MSALAGGLVLLLLATDSTTAQPGLVWTNLAIPTRDAKTLDADLWRTLEAAGHTLDRMSVPALIAGGWFDHFPDTVLRSFSDLQLESDAAVRDQHRLIFGPWLHGEVGKAQQGTLTFSNATNLKALEIAWQSVSNRTYDLLAAAGSPTAESLTLGRPPGSAVFFRVQTKP